MAKAKRRGRTPYSKYLHVVDSEYTIKLGRGVREYEYRVLQFLAQHTQVPSPRPLDFFTISVNVPHYIISGGQVIESEELEVVQWNVIVMSTIPGQTLARHWRTIPAKRERSIYRNVKKHMDDINKIIEMGSTFPDKDGIWSPIDFPRGVISDLDGEKGRVIRIPLLSGYIDGTVQRHDFIETMTATAPQPPDTAKLLQTTVLALAPSEINKSRFCHMDLHAANIMVSGGRLSGIIDWEMAGWYTESLEVYAASNLADVRKELGPILAAAWKVDSELIRLGSFGMTRLLCGHARYKEAEAVNRGSRVKRSSKKQSSGTADPASLEVERA